jgi:hypothetical protein
VCGVDTQQSMATAPASRSGPGLDLSGEQWLIAGAVVGRPAAASNEAGKCPRGFGQAVPKNHRTASELSGSYVRQAHPSAGGAGGGAQAPPQGAAPPTAVP